MEFTNPFAPSRREILPSDTTIMTTDTTIKVATRLSRRPSLRDNFSYPRLSRHGSNESRSSDGSVPGMTDTSDSDISFDDDGIYNTSAGELWDSFWPDSTTSSISRQSQEHQLALLRSEQHGDDFETDPIKRQQPFDAHGDAAKTTNKDYNRKVEELTTPNHTFQSPPSQYTPKKSAVAYSVYPRIPVISVQRHPHPPRTSSLSFEPPSPPQRALFLRSSRSSAALKLSKLGHNINPLFIAPSFASSSKATSLQQSSAAVKTAVSVPVSPTYPPPPTPKTLRPSTSAFNLREKARIHRNKNNKKNNNNKELVSHNVTAPPAPLLPSPLPEPLPTRPQVERFVSVFDFDSDSETEADVDERNSFAKRIARGLHKKSGSEKRGVAERKVVTPRFASLDVDASNKDLREGLRNGDSLSRKRGGSLGRIFGLIGR
ncbi:hypothetical protein F4782DRAFT_376965 [Xylaria castorea]|nr:hypothetical protein F4782DRAFT_376965 [Xylaria castorea]